MPSRSPPAGRASRSGSLLRPRRSATDTAVMGFFSILVLAALVAAGIVYAGYLAKKKRREAFALMAVQLGLRYSAADPFGIVSEPFALFAKGDGRGVENVMWGAWQGVDLRAFDYWYYEES